MPVSLDKEPSECHEQNNNFDDGDDDNDDDEDFKRPLRAPKNRENVFGEIPGTFCIVLTTNTLYLRRLTIVLRFSSTFTLEGFSKTN